MDLNFDEKLDSVPDEVINDFKAEKFDECFNACGKILSQNPTNKIALIYCGIISQKKDEDEIALKYFDEVLSLMPNFRYVWEYKGHSLLKIKEYDQAKQSFMRSLDLYKNNAAGWCFLALSVYLKGNEDSKEAAYYVLDSVHDMVDDKSALSLAKGILEEYDGRPDDALISYMQSQILAPGEEKEVTAERMYNLLK
jgi:predicted Zn-dependent protease